MFEEMLPIWMPPPMGTSSWILTNALSVTLASWKLELMDHHETLVKIFCKNAEAGLAIEANILALLEGLKLAIQPLSRGGFCSSPILGIWEGEKLVEVGWMVVPYYSKVKVFILLDSSGS